MKVCFVATDRALLIIRPIASTAPPLTTVVQPVAAMARAAGVRLLAQLQGMPIPVEPLIFAPELVRRASA